VECRVTQLDVRPARTDRAKFEDPDTRVARLYEAEIGRLTRFGRKLTGDSSAAEDLVQDVFLDLLEQLRRDPDYLQGPPWFWLREAMVHHAAKRQRQLTRESDRLGRLHASLPTELDRDEMHLDFEHAVTQLPARMRACVEMAFVHDMTQEGIAAVLGCSVRTVETHLRRARPRLADQLGVDWNPRPTRTSTEVDYGHAH
jgi:RNA polymerase sigma factor (sigma-70 family)